MTRPGPVPVRPIISTTLTANSEGIIADALRSVSGWVDLCLVIDTGVTDASILRAAEVAGAKLRVVQFQWTNDFAAARNFALAEAQRLGGAWAITIDTDERILPYDILRFAWAMLGNDGDAEQLALDYAQAFAVRIQYLAQRHRPMTRAI